MAYPTRQWLQTYVSVLTNRIVPRFCQPVIRDILSHKGGGPPYYANVANAVLDEGTSPYHKIGRSYVFMDWPPRLPDKCVSVIFSEVF